MPYVVNNVHCVWGTKGRYPFFTDSNTKDIMIHILNHARGNDIWIDHLNAYRDHMHCLITLQANQSLAKVINLIKGESSHWINETLYLDKEFGWADEYFASSVSIKMLPVVRLYIQNQPQHHQAKTWIQEKREYQRMITRLLEPFKWGPSTSLTPAFRPGTTQG